MKNFKIFALAAILPFAAYCDTFINTAFYYFAEDIRQSDTDGIIDPRVANLPYSSSSEYSFKATPPEGMTLDGWAMIDSTIIANAFTLSSLTNTQGKVAKIFDNWQNQYWTLNLTSQNWSPNFSVAGGTLFLYACPYFSYLKYNIQYYGNTKQIGGPWGEDENKDIVYTNEVQLAAEGTDYLWKTKTTGYYIAGWSLSTNGVAMFETGQKVTGKDFGVVSTNRNNSIVKLYAIWEKKEMPIALDAQGGEVTPESITVKIDETYDLPTPKRWGFDFQGWFDSPSGGAQIKDGDKVERDDIETLYAQWQELPTFKVEFIYFNETGEETRVTNNVPQGYDSPLPSNEETYWVGHTFVKWEPSPVNVSNNMSSTAQYSTNTYTVVFDPNGGRGKMDDQVFTYDEEQALAECTLSRGTTGAWAFGGWATAPDGEVVYDDKENLLNLTDKDNETITLYAVWQDNLTNNDLSKAADTDVALEISDGNSNYIKIISKDDPNTEDYIHTGDKSIEISRSGATLSATVRGSGKITFWVYSEDYNNLIVKLISGGESKTDSNFDSYYEWKLIEIDISPENDGDKTEIQWMNNSGTSRLLIDEIKWIPSGEYTIAYDANGANGEAMESELFLKGEWQRLSACSYTMTGYHFGGWALEQNSEAKFADKENVLDPFGENTKLNETNTLYAAWQANTYTVQFASAGGVGNMDDMLLTYDFETNLTACAYTFANHEFLGWSNVENGEVAFADSAEVLNLAAEDGATITLWAIWKENESGGGDDGGDDGNDETYSEELFPSEENSIGEFSSNYANVYNGWLSKDGKIAALVNIKTTAVKNSSKDSTATMTITPLTGKKSKVKFSVPSEDNPVTDEGMIFGALGICGNYNEYEINAAKDFTKAKVATEKAMVNQIPKGVWNFAFATGNGYAGFSLTLSAKGKAKLTGYLEDGTKISSTGLALLGEERIAVPIINSKKGFGFVVWLNDSDAIEITDLTNTSWEEVANGKTTNLANGSYSLDFETPTFRSYLEEVDDYTLLPSQEETITIAKGKWSVAKTFGKVKLAKNLEPYISYSGNKEPTNLSGLKLTYTAKTATVKGSFKLYCILGSKLKYDTVKITGAICNGKLYGSGKIKNQLPFPVKTK